MKITPRENYLLRTSQVAKGCLPAGGGGRGTPYNEIYGGNCPKEVHFSGVRYLKGYREFAN